MSRQVGEVAIVPVPQPRNYRQRAATRSLPMAPERGCHHGLAAGGGYTLMQSLAIALCIGLAACRSEDAPASPCTGSGDGAYVVVESTSVGGDAGWPHQDPSLLRLESLPVSGQQEQAFLVKRPPLACFAEMRPESLEVDTATVSTRITFHNTQALKAFSRDHVGARLAMVFDGSVVSSHTIRTPLEMETLKVTFCNRGAGERLSARLREAFPSMPVRHVTPSQIQGSH